MTLGLGLLAIGVFLLYLAARTRKQATPRPSLASRPPPREALESRTEPLSEPKDDVLPTLTATQRLSSRVVVSYEGDAERDEEPKSRVRIAIAAAGDTDRGQVRRSNDDALLLAPEHALFAVADGMGAYAGGKIASALAIETLKRAFEGSSFDAALTSEAKLTSPARELASSVLQSHESVFNAARATPEYSEMGTTLVAVRIAANEQRVYIAHVGDSRCYRFRGTTLRQLTTDQTMGLVGLCGPGATDLLQAVGVTEKLAIDLIVDRPMPEDIYLLCSDGLTKHVQDARIRDVLARSQDLEAAVYELIELANDAGGKDNITVLLIRVVDSEQPRASAKRDLKQEGWSKLPNVPVFEDCSSEDATVIGKLPLDEPTMIHRARGGNGPR